MPSQRQQRLADRLKEEIARILLREVEDPRVGFVTLTDVAVSPDMRNARVYFSVVDQTDVDGQEALKGLMRARKFIQRCLAEQAELRFTPALEFRYDATAARAQRVDALLHAIEADREVAPEQGVGDSGPADAEEADPPQ